MPEERHNQSAALAGKDAPMALIRAPSGNDGAGNRIPKNRPPVRCNPDLGNSSHYSSDSCTADGNSIRQTITLPTQLRLIPV